MPWHRRGNAHGAAAHGSSAYCASPLRRLRAGAAASSGGAAGRCPPSTQGFLSSNGHASSAVAWRRLKAFSQHGAWSQRPSRRKLTVSSCRLQHRPRFLVLLQTGPRHQARGPLALAPRTSRRTTTLLHTPCSSIRAHILPLHQGGKPDPAAASGRRDGSRWRTAAAGGLSHSKPKNLSHAT